MARIKVFDTTTQSWVYADKSFGKDGISPVISVTPITGGNRITITDAEGSKSIEVLNGSNGEDGNNGNGIKSVVMNADYTLTITFDNGTSYTTPSLRGSDGEDGTNGTNGVSPTVAIVPITGGHRISITDINGTKSVDVMDGAAGSDATVTYDSVVSALGYVPMGTGTNTPITGKKIVFDGDSIAASGGGFPKIIGEKTACIIENHAVGGARLCSNSDNHSVVDNLPNLPTDGDIYCFQGGINDFWGNTPVGTYTQGDYTGSVDPTTIYGAMETIFRYALTNFFGKAICFVITHKIQNTAYSKNTAGNTFWDYRKAMIDVCEKYSIPYYDAFTKSGLNGWNAAQKAGLFNSGDGTHPNTQGYEAYYVPQLISLFESIVPVGDYVAPEKPVTYRNVLKWDEDKGEELLCVDENGNYYNGKGWKEGTYLSYDGKTESTSANYDVTGWIKCKIGDVIRLKNVQLCKTVGTASKCLVACVTPGFAKVSSTAWLKDPSAFSATWQAVTNEAGTDVIQFTVPTALNNVGYIRLCCGMLTNASIITVNEEID